MRLIISTICLHLVVLCRGDSTTATTNNYNLFHHHDENRDLQQQQQQQTPPISSSATYSVNYNRGPTLHWMIQLQDPTDKLLRGNGIYQSPVNSNIVYVTTNSGKLLAISTIDGSIVASLKIDPLVYTNDYGIETWTIRCNSGLSFGSINGDSSSVDFLVYAIQDIPPPTTSEDSSSSDLKTRIVAVSIPDHEILWISSTLPGGDSTTTNNNPNNSPLVYYNRMGDQKPFIFMTHNSHYYNPSQNNIDDHITFDDDNNNSTTTTTKTVLVAGHVTLLDATNGGKVIWTDSEWNYHNNNKNISGGGSSSSSSSTQPKGYSPAGIYHNHRGGGGNGNAMLLYSGGDTTNKNDIVVWSNSGYSSDDSSINDDNRQEEEESNNNNNRPHQGFTFLFQLPIGFATDEVDEFDDMLQTKTLKVVRWNSITPPLFNKNGTDLFVGVSGSQVRGWTGGTKLDETATWSTSSLIYVDDENDSNEEDGKEMDDLAVAPVPARLTLSLDENRLFVPSADSNLICIDTRTGNTNWSYQGTSTFLAQSKISPDDQRVYAIQSVDGRIFSYDQVTGELTWLASCDQFEEDCANSVHADFEISSTGQFLIYGDVFGRIIALKLGELVEETITAPPIDTPAEDGGINLEHPSGPHTTWQKEDDGIHQIQDGTEKSERKSAAIVSTVVLVILASIVGMASLYMAILRSFKTRPHPMQEPYTIDMNNYDEDTVPSISDYSMPCSGDHPDNVLDKYEDSIISRHKVPSSEKPTSILDSLQFPSSTTTSNFTENMSTCWKTPPDTCASSFENMSHAPPADRISALLGTSNRVAPIHEDYSYGAFVLV